MSEKKNSGIEFLQKNIIKMVILGFVCYGGWVSYTKQIEKETQIITKIQTEMNKNDVLSNILRLENIFIDVGKKINEKDITNIPNVISQLAQKANVNILTTNKKEEEAFDLYIRYPYELTVSALNYHNLARFINLLESSMDIYTVETLNIKKNEMPPEANIYSPNFDIQKKTVSNTQSITAIIEVSTIELKTKL